jgi:phosphatidylserine/phosphatidylglycerophosphate/cardiolipin synthase-like enzyme
MVAPTLSRFSRSRYLALLVAALGVLVLATCSIYPPKDAVRGADGLAQVEAEYGIRPLDPAAKTPLLEQALEEVEKTDPLRYFRGRTYRLTAGNQLPKDWLLQTPNVWGKRGADVPFFPLDCKDCDADFRLPVCTTDPQCAPGKCAPLAATVRKRGGPALKMCVGHSDAVLDRLYRLIVSAQRAVDIAMLQPPADLRFLATLRNAITFLANERRAVTIRVIVGDHPPDGTDAAAFARELVRDAVIPGSRLAIFVGAMRSCSGEPSCGALSWNHAKIVAVDGHRAIVGGHNMWSPDYLAAAPVHDVSMEVDGPAATDAHRFLDQLWDFLCEQKPKEHVNEWHSALAGSAESGDECPSRISLPRQPPARDGGVPILAVGRLAAGIAPVFADQSLVARDLVLGAATKSVRMLMQDLPFAVAGVDLSWPEHALDALVGLLAKGGDVYLVLSNVNAAGPVGTYSMMVPIEAVATKMRDKLQKRMPLADAALNDLLCRHLHLAPLRFGPDATWPDDKPIGMHTKFWMVDNRAFYIGSENLYPSELQEFGYIVEDDKAAAQALQELWEPAWKWSQAAAISGEEASACVFRQKTAKR